MTNRVQDSIDLNADAGESFGVWTLGQDAALFDWVTTVNVAQHLLLIQYCLHCRTLV